MKTDQSRRRRAHRTYALRLAPARHQIDVGEARPAIRRGRLAGRPLPAALAEHEIADRARRRIERHLTEARLPIGKTLASFDLTPFPW